MRTAKRRRTASRNSSFATSYPKRMILQDEDNRPTDRQRSRIKMGRTLAFSRMIRIDVRLARLTDHSPGWAKIRSLRRHGEIRPAIGTVRALEIPIVVEVHRTELLNVQTRYCDLDRL